MHSPERERPIKPADARRTAFNRDSRRLPLDVKRVLVIEDDEGTQEYIRHILTRVGCEAAFCRTGREGLAEAKRTRPPVVLLDLGLPDINGVEVYKLLRAESATQGVRVLIMTSLGDTSGAIDSAIRTLRPDDYIHKPFGAEEFAARALRLLDVRDSNCSEPYASLGDLILRRGRIAVNLTRHEVHVQGKRIDLSPQPFSLLRQLIAQDESISVERILAEGWPECRDTGALRKAVQRLRQSLALRPDPIVYTGHSYKLIG